MERETTTRYAAALMTAAEHQVREWARKRREATRKRDEWVVKMRGEGASLRQIAAAAGTTAPTVERILKRAQGDAVGTD